MTFEDLKRECSRYGITITNPRTECIKKLISCELSKKVFFYNVYHQGHQKVIISSWLTSLASTSFSKSFHYSYILLIETTSHQRPPPLSHLSIIFIIYQAKVPSLHQLSRNVNHLLYYHHGYYQAVINVVKFHLLLNCLIQLKLLLPLHLE